MTFLNMSTCSCGRDDSREPANKPMLLMDLAKLPIWLAYVLAPALLVLFSGKVVLRSESPLVIAAIAVGLGVVCAGLLHVYVFIKRKLTRSDTVASGDDLPADA
jgi:hypothetical protein